MDQTTSDALGAAFAQLSAEPERFAGVATGGEALLEKQRVACRLRFRPGL